jgi:oligoribonuclease NrnB/cAMP/cGMP phosphodiesterase (DHH superfamily)
MTERKSTLIVYHGSCDDGWTAAWAAWLRFGDTAEYVEGHYPPVGEFDVDGRDVYFLDYCPTREKLDAFQKRAKSLRIIDHHRTAEDVCVGLDFATFDMNRSGAGLTWDEIHTNVPRPRLVDYIEDRDLWNWKLPNSKEINAYVQSIPRDTFDNWSGLADIVEKQPKLVIETGKALLRAEQRNIDMCKASVRVLTFLGYPEVPVVNVNGANVSLLLNQLAKPNYFAVGWYQRADGTFSISMRAKDFDVARIAEKFGGGGHKLAARFTSTIPPWELSAAVEGL